MERMSLKEAGLTDLPRIRGHHLHTLIDLYKYVSQAKIRLSNNGYKDRLPEDVDERLKKWVDKSTKGLKDPYTYTLQPGFNFRWYIADVIGPTEEDEKIYCQNIYKVVVKVISALPDERVLLTETPDLICGACKIGDHCLIKGAVSKNPYLDLNNLADYKYKISILGGMTENYFEDYKYSNSGCVEQTEVVLTNFGDLRTFLQQRADLIP